MESEDDIQPLIYYEAEVRRQGGTRDSFLGLRSQTLNTDPDLEQVIYYIMSLSIHHI